jgi:hypothetical protein
MGAAVFALAASLCLLGGFAAVALADGAIEGTVTAAGGGPIEDAEVCAWPLSIEEEGEEEVAAGGCTLTGSDGTYSLPSQPAGEYEVEFWASGYVLQFYDGKESRAEADPVTVGTGATTGIDAELEGAAGFEGTVTRSSDGEPVEEVEVCAWTAIVEDFAGCTYTGSDGSYLLSELEPGEYEVGFYTDYTGQNLAWQIYNGKTRWSEADFVTVNAGAVTTGIDAALDPGATIEGSVQAASGAFLQEIPVCAITVSEELLAACTETDPVGNYSLRLLPEDQYKVAFSIDLNEWFGTDIFPDDGYETEYWNNQTTFAAANPIALIAGQSEGGINAILGSLPVTPPGTPTPPALVVPPPTVTPPVTTPRKRKCRKGFRKKKVRGKVRCVKIRKHRRKQRSQGSQLTIPGDLSRVTSPRLLR